MTSIYCDICGGGGQINLAVKKRMPVSLTDEDPYEVSIAASYRTYPCPECNPSDGLRVEELECRYKFPVPHDLDTRYPPEAKAMLERDRKRHAVHAMVEEISKQYDRFVRERKRYLKAEHMDEYTVKMYIMTTDSLAPSIEQQVQKQLRSEIEGARMVFKEKIYSWNTHGDWLYKSQAASAADEAFNEVCGESD